MEKEIVKAAFINLAVLGVGYLTGALTVSTALVAYTGIGAILTLAVGLGFSVLVDWLKDRAAEIRYGILDSCDLIKPSADEVEVTGYITDKFYDDDYIELETEEGKILKIQREHGLAIIINSVLTESGNTIEIKEDEEVDDSYNVYIDFNALSYDTSYWVLQKKEGLYYIEKRRNNNAYYELLNNLSNEDRQKISRGIMFSNLMAMVGMIQRNYLDKREDILKVIYPYEDGVKVTNSISEAEKDIEEREREDYNPNEFLYLPFINDEEKQGYIDGLY